MLEWCQTRQGEPLPFLGTFYKSFFLLIIFFIVFLWKKQNHTSFFFLNGTYINLLITLLKEILKQNVFICLFQQMYPTIHYNRYYCTLKYIPSCVVILWSELKYFLNFEFYLKLKKMWVLIWNYPKIIGIKMWFKFFTIMLLWLLHEKICLGVCVKLCCFENSKLYL